MSLKSNAERAAARSNWLASCGADGCTEAISACARPLDRHDGRAGERPCAHHRGGAAGGRRGTIGSRPDRLLQHKSSGAVRPTLEAALEVGSSDPWGRRRGRLGAHHGSRQSLWTILASFAVPRCAWVNEVVRLLLKHHDHDAVTAKQRPS